MTKKISESIQKSKLSLQKMLVTFFRQNSEPKIIPFEEHTTAALRQSEERREKSPAEDSRAAYWKEREARPTIDNIGSNLEWGLLMSHVNLNPAWRHDGWWCDDVIFFDVVLNSPKPNSLRGMALTYWLTSEGTFRNDKNLPGFALAEFDLQLVGDDKQLKYTISLWMDDHYFGFSHHDFITLPLSSQDSLQPQMSKLLRFLLDKTDYKKLKLPQINFQKSVLPSLFHKFAPHLIPANQKFQHLKNETITLPKYYENPFLSELNLSELIKKLSDPEIRIACIAADIIGEKGLEAQLAIPDLLSIVYAEDKNDSLRGDSFKAIAKIGVDENEAIKLFEFFSHNSPWWISKFDKPNLLEILSFTGSKAIPSVFEYLKNDSDDPNIEYDICSISFDYLKQQGEYSLPAYLELIKMKKWFSDTLLALPYAGEKAIPALIEVLQNKTPYIRASAIEGLCKIGSPDAKTMQALNQSLQDSDLLVCTRAAEALGKLGAVAVPSLIEALEIEDNLILCWVMKSLGEIGAEAKSALDKLKALAISDDVTIRYFATHAIEQIS
jgi:HEAT repeat protein